MKRRRSKPPSDGLSEHQVSVDRALEALQSAAGATRVMSHLASSVTAPGTAVRFEELVAAFRHFREVAPLPLVESGPSAAYPRRNGA